MRVSADSNTNGILIPKWKEELKKLELIIISLDGELETNNLMRGKNVRTQCIEAIEQVHRQKIAIILSSVITCQTSTKDIDYLLKLCNHYRMLCFFQIVNDRAMIDGQWRECSQISQYVLNLAKISSLIGYIKQHQLVDRVLGHRY